MAKARAADGGRYFNVGVVWHGSQSQTLYRSSIPLGCYEPLAHVPGVRLISLQKGPGVEQLAAAAERFGVVDWSTRLDKDAPFVDTAALMMNLDLVVSIDTALAHLAGALGVRGWIALPLVPDWRWQLHRADSPWYPTLRLFRQPAANAWEQVFEQMAAELRHTV